MLDVPNFFWESEPTLYPLYIAVREYLEIKPRIQVLNERCRVFLDLTEILSDSIADNRVSRKYLLPFHVKMGMANTTLSNRKDQTWIIIILIGISILVTASEVFLRFGLLHARGNAAVSVPGSNRTSLPAIVFTNLVRSLSSSRARTLSPPQCICPPVTCPSILSSSSSRRPSVLSETSQHSSPDDNDLISPLALLT